MIKENSRNFSDVVFDESYDVTDQFHIDRANDYVPDEDIKNKKGRLNKNQIKALELNDLVTNKMYEKNLNSPVELQSGTIKIGIGNIGNTYNKYNKNSDNNHVINERLLNSNVSVADILQSSLLKKNKSKQIINNQKVNNQQSNNNNGFDKIEESFPYTNRDYEEEDISYKYYNQASNTNSINHINLKGNEGKNNSKTIKKPIQNNNQLIGNNYNQNKSKIYPNFVNTNIAHNVNDKEPNQENVNLARSGKFSIEEDPYYLGSNQNHQNQNININNNQNQNHNYQIQNFNNLKKNTNIKIKIDKEKENPKDIYSIYQNLMKTNTKNKVITNSLNNNTKINNENSKLLQNSTRK